MKTAAGEVPLALQIANSISNEESIISTYAEIIHLLIAKGDLRSAKDVALAMKEEWFPWSGSIRALQDLAAAYVKSGDISGVLAWAREKKNSYAKAVLLLGAGIAKLEQHGLPNLGEQVLNFGSRRSKCD